VQTRFKLYVIGDGPEYGKLRALAYELGLENTVIFKGYQRNIKQWLEETDIFLLPSLSECHSISLLEAMRSGKPIIATNVGGNPETIRDGIDGIIVPPKNPEAIAGALTELMMRPSLQFKFGESARNRFLDKFTESLMLKNLANAFKTVQ
jgi:glycosyltransferase involved in cell wall biosynthesis